MSMPDDLVDRLKARKGILAAGIAVIAVLAGMLVFFIMDDGPSDDEPIANPDAVIRIELDRGMYIELTDDFVSGDLNAYINNSGELIIYLDEGIASGYSNFAWVLRNEQDNTYKTAVKTAPDVKWTDPEVGLFSVTAFCYIEPEDDRPATSYFGYMRYYGDKVTEYSWTYGGRAFTADYTISAQDVGRYSSPTYVTSSIRHGTDITQLADFTVVDDSVAGLQASLRSAFDGAYPYDEGRYADFMLSFVNQCISFASDTYNYSVNHYRAFPVETLFIGSGDSEDKCILYATLLSCAGIGCGILALPGYFMVAVETSVAPPALIPEGFVFEEFFHLERKYTAADTIKGDALGLMRDCFSFDLFRDQFYYYGNYIEGDFGLVLLRICLYGSAYGATWLSDSHRPPARNTSSWYS